MTLIITKSLNLFQVNKMINEIFGTESQIVEIKPITVKLEQKAVSVTLVKRYNYDEGNRVIEETAFFKDLLAHRIDNSPRVRSFSI